MRKLATCAASYVGALILARYVLPEGYALWFGIAAAVLALLCLFLRGDKRTRALLITVSMSAGLIWHWGFTMLFVAPTEKYIGETMTVTARVIDYGRDNKEYNSINLLLTDERLPRTKILAYETEGSSFLELEPGQIIEVNLRFTSATEKMGELTDSYTSRGVFLRGYMQGEPEVTGEYGASFIYFPKTIARYIGQRAEEIFPEAAAPYMKAVLIGNKDLLYEDLDAYNALSTSGILHTVAVSGMHLSFLWGAIQLLAGSKRRAAAFGIPALWFFALVAGITPSVVRAAFMLSLSMVAPLIKRENDGLTSLGTAILIILIFNPLAIGSVSLQLSFAAMLGIITITPRIFSWTKAKWKRPEKSWLAKLRSFVLASFSSSIGAIVFTTPLSAVYFGYVSIVSPITNMLTFSAVSFCFLGGYMAVGLGALANFLGIAAGWVVSWGARYIIGIAALLSKLPFAAVYTSNHMVVWWLLLVYVVFALAYAFKREKDFRPVIPISISVIAFSVMIILTTVTLKNGSGTITVIGVGQGQSIAVLDRDNAVVIDCGCTGNGRGAGNKTADFLLANGHREIDMLLLTHLHADHANGVETLLSRVQVDNIVMPASVNDEDYLLNEIIEAAEEYDVKVSYIKEDSLTKLGAMDFTLYEPTESGEANERGLIIMVTIGSFDMLVTGDINTAAEREFVRENMLPDMELLIVGHHGSKYSTSLDLLAAIHAETAVISVGYNSYGHPTEETLERLELYGMEIHRTDLEGNVTVRVGTYG